MMDTAPNRSSPSCVRRRSCCRWARWLKDLEEENTQLKKLVADQALDMAILKDVASGRL
jgi:hypothetical protein